MPALKPKVRIPVPPPTEPSTTGPPRAESSAAKTCSRRTWKPLMSFRNPSQVSATTGRLQSGASRFCCAQAIVASWTAPTLWVFVIITAPSRMPRSRSQVVPVISPFPFSVNQAAKTRPRLARPRGSTAVTPVRTGPSPTRSFPSPRMMVWCPTSTPATSVIALSGPGSPSKGTPRSRARLLRRQGRRGEKDGQRREGRGAAAESGVSLRVPVHVSARVPVHVGDASFGRESSRTGSGGRRADAAAGRGRYGTADAGGRGRTCGRPPGTAGPRSSA